MRTKTGILWTIIMFGFLHQNTKVLVIVSGDPVDITNTTQPTTTVPPSAASTTRNPPSTTSAAGDPASSVSPTKDPVSVTTDSPTTGSSPAHPTTGALPAADPTSGNSASATTTFVDPSSTINASASLLSTVSNLVSTDLTTLNPTTIKHAPTDSAPQTLAPADPTATSAPVHTVLTLSVTANIENSITVHSVTSKVDGPAHEDLASTTNIAAPSVANTESSPALESKDQFSTPQSPSLTNVFQPTTSKSIVQGTFHEMVSSESIQDTNNTDTNVKFCRMLLEKLAITGNCSVSGKKINDDHELTSVSLAVDLLQAQDIYNKISSQKADSTSVPYTLIAILSSCGALVLILVCFALYCMCHHRSYRKNQQHLTEELQTVENGYHDNPTLEVFEVQPEMQEKKLALNGEFNDSWIVPIDNLAKENIPDEEDTHL